MAKKTKDSEIEETVAKKASKTTKSKTTATKKTSAKKATSTLKQATTKKSKTPTAKEKSVASLSKKTVAVKDLENGSVSKKSTTKKNTTKRNTTKKSTTRVSKKETLKKSFQSEYYDLPYFYNKTVVKILAQTPKMLFIYWEISKSDRESLQKQYGENFFETTRPVLIVFNDTMHYSFEVNIDDFANSWYLHINDANCEYHVELGRRPVIFNNSNYNYYSNNSEQHVYTPYYVYLTSSNEMSAPNNKILFNPSVKTIKFRNVKTGQVKERDINDFTFITNFGIFKIQDLYKYLYPNENFEFKNISIGSLSSGRNFSGLCQ